MCEATMTTRQLILLSIVLQACTGTSVVPVSDSMDASVRMPDETGSETAIAPDLVRLEVSSDLFDGDVAEHETVGPACDPGEGCFLDKCQDNSDCQSGWCVEHMGEALCSILCQEECPPGWTCKQVSATGPDVVYICVSDHANLCRPCSTGDNCKAVGGAEDACVDYGPEGSFCGGKCVASQACPWGFSCKEAVTVDGATLTQCVADAGVCPCTDRSVELGLWTSCVAGNEWGLCAGKRFCTEEGLSPCDAMIPAEEECNGLDDNCDGETDESTCDDDNTCTTDSCLGEAGCDYLLVDGGECLDGNPCTVADHCAQGVCLGTPVDCDDDNPCTDDGCDEFGGCVFSDNQGPCDDGDPCTLGDQCKEGLCVGIVMPCDCQADGDCEALEDGDLCNGTLVCDLSEIPYQCVLAPATIVECPQPEGPAASCLEPTCAPASAECSFAPLQDGLPCEDGSACTLGDTCADGECMPGLAANCNDGNLCTDDSCDPGNGCSNTPNQTSCNDGDVCTLGDLCVAGACLAGGESVGCDDGNTCTDDHCDSALGCVYEANVGECSDGNACTIGDHCAGAMCVAGEMEVCDDGKLCTTDHCEPLAGCVFSLNEVPCDDNDVCSTGDHCHLGECIFSGELECDDNNPCTDDSCNPLSGCLFQPNQVPCEDGNACTEDDLCQGGLCLAGTPGDCDDGNQCTDDSCDPVAGCLNVANSLACDDGNACTTGDVCTFGTCAGTDTSPIDCDDGNVCTDDFCAPVTGCSHEHNTLGCDDADGCTKDDTCASGICAGKPCEEYALVCHNGECVEELPCESGSQLFNPTNDIVSWQVPACVTSLTIEVWGAEGGRNTDDDRPGGRGARLRGVVGVEGGTTLKVLAGGKGEDAKSNAGGGGGSFVWVDSIDELFIAAGGGGGGGYDNFGMDGVISEQGSSGNGLPVGAGTDGNGGVCPDGYGYCGGGGAGWKTNGSPGKTSASCFVGSLAKRPLEGGTGGIHGGDLGYVGDGGFGGGGGGQGGCTASGGGGGGGGYSGGGPGGYLAPDIRGGGGGGSYNAGTDQSNTPGVRIGDGMVEISW